jgi:hypothetical protein
MRAGRSTAIEAVALALREWSRSAAHIGIVIGEISRDGGKAAEFI